MNRTAAGVLSFAILFSVVGAGGRGEGPPSRGEAQEPPRVKNEASTPPAEKAPTCSFEARLLGVVRSSLETGPDRTSNVSEDCPGQFVIPADKRSQAKLIFAVVPDPVHTNLALFFDRQIDALQQGVQDSGWIFDSALMPWDYRQHPESTDFRIRDQQDESQRHSEENPGIILFRRKGPERLLVLVIGENPTGGIEKQQFRTAVRIARQLYGSNTPDAFFMFGPTFSGSLQSLSELLDCSAAQSFPCNVKKKIIYSGTITSRTRAEEFQQRIPAVAFASLEEFDEFAIQRFLDFAVDRGYCTNHIAILSEDETAYGAGFAKEGKAPHEHGGGCVKEKNVDEMVGLYFPREISHLRNAYQQNVQKNLASTEKAPRTTLPLDLASTGTNDDTVQQYSGTQMPLSQEAVLLGITSELRRHHVELLLLRSTDSLDQLFLSRYLRSAYPQVRIITVGADLLFRREVQDSRLHGIMALTTYSLVPGADHELHGGTAVHVDRVFPGSDSVGSYNAARLLLSVAETGLKCEGKSEQDCKVPIQSVHLFQYGWPQEAVAGDGVSEPYPPVHLTVLGHDGFWEVTVLPDPKAGEFPWQTVRQKLRSPMSLFSSSIQSRDPPVVSVTIPEHRSGLPPVNDPEGHEAHRARLPSSWRIYWLIAVGLALAYCYFIWTASMLSSSEAIAHLAPPRKDSRGILFATAGYLHFCLLAAVLWPFGYLDSDSSRWAPWVIIFAMLIVVVACARDLVRRGAMSYAIGLYLTCVLTAEWLLSTWHPDYAHYMFVRRAVHLTSGVSPLLPILLLLSAGLWGVWYSLSGTALIDSSRPQLPRWSRSHRFPRFQAILEDDQERLLQLLRPNYPDRKSVVVVLTVIGAFAWITQRRPVLALEGKGYEFLLATLVGIVFALLVWSTLRLQNIWMELRRLLLALDGLPLRRGFRRLKGFSWSPMWRAGAGNLGDFRRLLARESDALRAVINLEVDSFDEIGKAYAKHIRESRGAYEMAMKSYQERGGASPTGGPASKGKGWIGIVRERARRENRLVDKFVDLQKLLARAALAALSFAAGKWEKSKSANFNVEDEASETRQEEERQSHFEKRERAQVDACEQFIALHYTTFILTVLVRIRSLIVAIGGVYVLFLLAVSIYPFQPQLGIRLSLLLLFVFIVAIVGLVYAQMHRDATLSYITDTTPGELGSDFWIRIVSFVALPGFGLLASQFPEVSDFIYSWVEPAVHALK